MIDYLTKAFAFVYVINVGIGGGVQEDRVSSSYLQSIYYLSYIKLPESAAQFSGLGIVSFEF